MIKFNKIYENTIQYPCKIRELLRNICNQANVELATESFQNQNFLVTFWLVLLFLFGELLLFVHSIF